MSFLLDIFPLAVFFVAYKLQGAIFATGALVVAVLLQTLIYWLKTKEVKKMHMATAVLAVVFGGITIALGDPRFIQWKFTVVYWLFAVVFLTSTLWSKKPLVQTMLETVLKESGNGEVDIPSSVWHRMNSLWVTMFFVLGAVNIYVLRNFSMDAWTNFKVFWSTAAFFLFIVANIVWLFKYLPDEEQS
ncbi:MAG: inner membrane-spanning protein YciB [Pseudomonadota bacterium]